MCGRGRAGAPRGPGCLVTPRPHPQVPEILGAILAHLPTVDHREVRRLLIEGLLLLAHYHQETVLTALLRQPLPMERWVPRCGASASRAPQTATTDMSQEPGALSSASSDLCQGKGVVGPSHLHLCGWYSL